MASVEKSLSERGVSENLESVFPIVGIGASAGGLMAIEAFFSGMPSDRDPGMAFVLVQHLDPDHKSILADLVKRYTRMDVFQVEDGMKVRPNCAYIIPPNHDMAFLNGELHLFEPSAPRGLRLPIDFFFRSLAQDQHGRAVGIVLSGTGSDGALGVRAIKGEGGMVMAQSPETAEYDGMPRNAIATGLVDFVLPASEMARQLMTYAGQAFAHPQDRALLTSPQDEETLKKIFALLRIQSDHDFSQYKRNTILRRIERRMAVQQVDSLGNYVRFLQQTPTEVEALFRDLLIGVTRFFRDPEAFASLQAKVLPRLLAEREAGALIRVWVAGCSTGEEAYSIAILLQEEMERLTRKFHLQIFATDLDSQAIDQARAGIYPASIAADVSPERLSRFFSLETGSTSFQIKKSIRDMIIFSVQDVIKDPPFSKVDLICCRNMMIYLGSDLQKKVVSLFHYALNPDGVLFLGTSETVGELLDYFSTLDRKAKIYLRTGGLQKAPRLCFERETHSFAEALVGQSRQRGVLGQKKIHFQELSERTLLQHLGVAAVLVNELGDIQYLHGRTGRYLEPAPGEAELNILDMAREGLRSELMISLRNAVTTGEVVRRAGIRVRTNGDYSCVNLAVRPVTTGVDGTGKPEYFLVVLEEITADARMDTVPPDAGNGAAAIASEGVDPQILALRQELRGKEEYLQAANEELATSNEELRSSNEEMQSINEELQSTNEELETSKEELQSMNEELATVNSELQVKVADLAQANNDMNNFLAGTGIGTIFVDHELRIQRFTPIVTQVINLIVTDVGRPVGHIVSNLLGYDSLVTDVQGVLDTLLPKDVEVQTKAGVWYLLRIRPYRTLENVIEGAVIMFFELTEFKKGGKGK